MYRNKSIRILGIFVALLFLVAACGQAEEPAGDADSAGDEDVDEYVVGALLQLSGEVAYFGEWTRNGIELAVQDINDAGGVNGKPFSVKYRDSENDSATAVAEFRKFADIDGVPAVMASGSVAVLPVCPVAEELQVLLMNASANSPLIRDCGDYTASLISDSAVEMEAAAEFLYNERDIRRVATLNMNNDVNVGIRDAFISKWEELGGEIVARESAEIGTQNFRSQLTALRSQNPEATLLAAEAPDAAVILKHANQLGFETQWFAQTAAVNQDVIDIAGPGAEGVLITQIGFDPETGSPEMQEFEEKYNEEFEENPALVYSATFYDATRLLADAIENGGYSGSAIAEYVNSLETFEGASGTANFIEPGVVERDVIFRTVEGGEFTRLD